MKIIRDRAEIQEAAALCELPGQSLKDRLLNHMKYRCENQTLLVVFR